MITEDYVSFETAKLLKEKGFDVWGDGSFGTETKIWKEYSPSGMINDCSTSSPNRKAFPAPTLQMAMKWLREVYRIDIEVRTYYLNCLKPNDTRYYSGKILKGSEDIIHTIYSKDTYEEVCENAIKYALENLI